jgi:hypothetical protein
MTRLITRSGDFDESSRHCIENAIVYAARISRAVAARGSGAARPGLAWLGSK